MLKVAVLGALGRMGEEVIRAVEKDPQLEVVAVVDPRIDDEFAGRGMAAGRDIGFLENCVVDVAVDFTQAAAAVPNILWALGHGVNIVVGTTGIDERDLEKIRLAAEDGEANALIAPNFALGAVFMMKFAREAARVFDQCEIVELHHRGKKDAPSGTALMTAEQIAASMDATGVPDSTENRVHGARGGTLGDVRIHSVRLDGFVAHQEVIFGSPGQTLTIRHDTTDRSCFMPGVLMAVKAVGDLPGLTIGLEVLLP